MLPPTILSPLPPLGGESLRAGPALGAGAGAAEWETAIPSLAGEYLGVLGVVAAVTVAGCLLPLSYRSLGYVYLLTVLLLGVRVGRGPTLCAVISSALIWNYVFIPPRFSLRILDWDDGVHLGAFLLVALIAGHLTTQFRARERSGQRREKQANALLQLARAVAGTASLPEAIETALRHTDGLMGTSTTLLLTGTGGALEPYSPGTPALPEAERVFAEVICRHAGSAAESAAELSPGGRWHFPLLRGGVGFGVFVVALPARCSRLASERQALLKGLAEQIGLLIEREHLLARQRPAEANQLHGALLNSVSHELKTPLAILRSAGDKLAAAETGASAAWIQEIRAATQRLDRLVGNLLSQTRLQSGALKPLPDWCDVRDIVQSARRSLDNSLSGHPLRVDLPSSLPLIWADAPLMEHVFSNLLLNAALHTPPGCPIEIGARRETTDGRGRILIWVSDHGPGLPPELHGTLFRQFHRGPAARAGGLGLGLSIVRGFALAHGGDVVACNNPGGGARFTVSLPDVRNECGPAEDA